MSGGAGYHDPKIEVQNFVALEIAYLIDIEVKFDLERTQSESEGSEDELSEPRPKQHLR